MNCQTCQPTLLELASGELGSAAADAAREHLLECESCRAAFDKVSAGLKLAQALPLAAVPSELSARLNAQAVQHVRALQLAQQTRPAAAPPAWRAFLDFVSRFAMARQVGMATISLLIVAVGLWSLPQLRHEHAVQIPTSAVSSTAEPAAPPTPPAPVASAPSAAPTAAAEVAASAPARWKKIDGLAAQPAKREATEPALAVNESRRRGASANQSPDSFLRARSADSEGAPGRGGLAQEMSVGSVGDEVAKGSRSSSSTGAGARPTRQPSAFPSSPHAEPEDQRLALREERVTAPAKSAAAPPPPATQATAAGEISDSAAEKARSAHANAQPAQSIDALTSARVFAKQRGCAAALPAFQQIIARAPDSPDAGAAMIEIAGCKRSMGDYAGARALLERAARIAAVTSRAQALMRLLPEAKASSAVEPSAPAAASPPPH